ncbi:hypothetical protein COP2_005614 [Malus domestica]
MLRHGLVASAFVNMFARKAQGEHALISGSMEQGKWVHAHMIKSAVTLVAFVVNTLLDMYAKSGSIEDAKKVSEKPQVILCNNYASTGRWSDAAKLRRMI